MDITHYSLAQPNVHLFQSPPSSYYPLPLTSLLLLPASLFSTITLHLHFQSSVQHFSLLFHNHLLFSHPVFPFNYFVSHLLSLLRFRKNLLSFFIVMLPSHFTFLSPAVFFHCLDVSLSFLLPCTTNCTLIFPYECCFYLTKYGTFPLHSHPPFLEPTIPSTTFVLSHCRFALLKSSSLLSYTTTVSFLSRGKFFFFFFSP